MSDCPTNTVVSDQIQNETIQADFIQGVMNRLTAYFDKYNVSTIKEESRIGYVHSRYAEDPSLIHYKKVLHILVQGLHDTMDNYKDQETGSGGDFTWTGLSQYNKIEITEADEIKTNLETLESQCWSCHGPVGDESCTCHITCDAHVMCSCDSTCYGVGCYCNASTHGYSCTCDFSAHDAGTWGGVPFCGCHNVCHGYACDCHSTCYLETHCFTCDATCDGYSCNCHNICYAYSCNQCHGMVY